MKARGRPVKGAIFGFLFGIFVTLNLLMFEVRPLDTVGTVVIPVAGLVLGILIGFVAPFGRRSSPASPSQGVPPPAASPPPQ